MGSTNKVAYVLDTAALFASYPLMLPPIIEVLTTSEVVKEVIDEESRRSLEYSIESGKLRIKDPNENSIKEAIEAAHKLGEGCRLSRTDITLIALTIQLLKDGFTVYLVTDDYSIQNIAKFLGAKVIGIKRRVISKVIKYVFKCPSCGYKSSSETKCPICGTEMTRHGAPATNQPPSSS